MVPVNRLFLVLLCSSATSRGVYTRVHSQHRSQYMPGRRSFSKKLFLTSVGLPLLSPFRTIAETTEVEVPIEAQSDVYLGSQPSFVASLYANIKEAQFTDWEISGLDPNPHSDPYPEWLLGKWDVVGKFADAEFPLGRGKFSPFIAGARRMSVAPMPNIGADVKDYQQRFIKQQNGQILPDWEGNIRESIPAFWPEAHLTSAKFRPEQSPKHNKFTIEYSGPTRKYKEVEQACSVEFIQQQSILISKDKFVIGENIVQDNVEQDLTTRYTHIQSFEKREDGNILSRQRVASFAVVGGPDDKLAEEAKGRPIGIFEYYYLFRPAQ
ncbi:hypothetical protein AAMO2058_001345900 [Amorphochlora amoebiformis]